MKGGKGGSGEAEKARAAEEARQARVRAGTNRIDRTFNQFDDDFFADRRASFVDFARPQVDRQRDDAMEQMTYALARAGTSNSSIAGEQAADLDRRYKIQLQDIADQGRAYESEARNAVEDSRASLVASLNATGDATGAANAALARAAALSQQPAFSPLPNLFADVTNGLSQQAALERAEAATGKDYARYDTPLFGAPRGAVQVRK